MRHVPEIKLIRTDTTLDLSQKAEKVWTGPPQLAAQLCAHRLACRTRRVMQRCMREPGIEPGPTPWQGAILPLDHSRLLVVAERVRVAQWKSA